MIDFLDLAKAERQRLLEEAKGRPSFADLLVPLVVLAFVAGALVAVLVADYLLP